MKSNVDRYTRSVIQRLLFILTVEGQHQEPLAGVNSAASICLQCEFTCLESYTFSNHCSATAYTSFFPCNIHTPDFHMIVLKTDSISSVHATFSPDLSSSHPFDTIEQWPSQYKIRNLTTLFPIPTSPPTSSRPLGHPLLALRALTIQRWSRVCISLCQTLTLGRIVLTEKKGRVLRKGG